MLSFRVFVKYVWKLDQIPPTLALGQGIINISSLISQEKIYFILHFYQLFIINYYNDFNLIFNVYIKFT